jgi:hypothetical protein
VWHLTRDSTGWHLDSEGVDVSGFPSPPNANQPGGPNNIDTGDSRLLFAFWKNGHLSTGQNIACSFNPNPNTSDCAATRRWTCRVGWRASGW